MAEDDVTTKVFGNTKACACVDMLIEVDVCKTVANDVCLQRDESHGNILFRRMNLQIQLFGHGLTYEVIRASRVDDRVLREYFHRRTSKYLIRSFDVQLC